MSPERVQTRSRRKDPVGWVELRYGLNEQVFAARDTLNRFAKIDPTRLEVKITEEEKYGRGWKYIRFEVSPEELKRAFRNRPSVRRIFHDLNVMSSDLVEVRVEFLKDSGLCTEVAFIPKEVTKNRYGIALTNSSSLIAPGKWGEIIDSADETDFNPNVATNILEVYNKTYGGDQMFPHPWMAKIRISAFRWVEELLEARVKKSR